MQSRFGEGGGAKISAYLTHLFCLKKVVLTEIKSPLVLSRVLIMNNMGSRENNTGDNCRRRRIIQPAATDVEMNIYEYYI